MHEGTKLHEDDFARRVNFARVTFLHEKITQKKKKITKKKDLKKKEKKLLTEGKGYG